MTYKTHTYKVSDPDTTPEGGIATGNMHAILRMLEERILMGGEEAAELALRFAPPHTSFGKSLRDTDVHNVRMWQKKLEISQEQNKYEPDNSTSSEDDASARADLADVLFKLQHSIVNAAAMEPNNQEDETSTS